MSYNLVEDDMSDDSVDDWDYRHLTDFNDDDYDDGDCY